MTAAPAPIEGPATCGANGDAAGPTAGVLPVPPIAPVGFSQTSVWDGVERRGRSNEENETVTSAQEWRAVTASPYVWELCSHLPHNNTFNPTGGRKRDYPDWLMLFLVIAMPMFGGSTRSATAALADPAEWARFAAHAHPYIPAGWTSPLTGLPKANNATQDRYDRIAGTLMPAPRRHHITYFLFCWRGVPSRAKTPPAHWAHTRRTIMTQFRVIATAQALAEGRFRDDERFHPTRPNLNASANFDGTVFPFRRSPRSTAANPGMDTHLGMWVTGTGNKVYGSKYVLASTRTVDYKSRIILDVRHVQHRVEGESGEAKAVLAILKDTLPQAPGIRVVTCDSALRGQDAAAVHALGPIVVNDPHVKRRADDEAGTPAIPKSHLATVIRGNACEHHIVYQHGAPYERTLDGDGNTILSSLRIAEYKRYRNNNGTFRHYHTLTVPCPDGDHLERVPLFHNDGPDSGLDFNRGEYIRVIPPGTPEHKAWYGIRNDTEALHSELKRRKIRLPRNSVPAQDICILGYAIGQNAVAHAMWLRQQGQPNALDNTA